ncbi:MAG: hypothetical protein D3914_05240, partial [Candidatus Electrothrix sp. LOE2]|nr:hypothetical protein [Candidatus Electrothrix sp. LOE2]
YAFVHRTFLEYFCATEFVYQFETKQSLSLEGLLEIYDAHCRDDDWQEVLRMICGQLDERFAGRIIAHLTDLVDLKAWDGETPLPELSLAIWCMNEVRSGAQLEKAGATLLLNTVQYFLTEKYPQDSFVSDFVAAAQDIGTRWPGKSSFQFKSQYPTNNTLYHHLYWPYFLDAVFEQRSWIEELATCDNWYVRYGAINVLTKKWPDEETRQLLTERAVQDEHADLRSIALRALAEKWPDQNTRKLFEQRAVQDEDKYLRNTALRVLVDKWPDETTRELLTERAVQDEYQNVRSTALRALVEKWPDEETRELLTERAVQDEHKDVCCTALEQLAQHWPDDETHQMLRKLVPVEGMAASWYGAMHSPFGGIIFTEDLDEIRPYCNPRQPIPSKHIQKAAEEADIPPDKIDETVRSLSEHMGWDITKGSEAGKLP